ncbi:MAG: tRNA uridine-5-carboxymethylaminomethyl(34) synthesis enzyme MnmG [Clostridia bacterium]
MKKKFDAIIIGAGHAGAEAAHALATLGKDTLIMTMSLDSVAFMACNPNIGGTAKGHLVREIDALGGIMGELADKATIQTRMLNLGNGPAVHSLRAQVDKNLYHRLVKERLEKTPNLTLLEAEAAEILFDGKTVKGIKTALGDSYFAPVVILATGVFLNAKVIIGEYTKTVGPSGLMRSESLAESLEKNGLKLRRFKTGTPPRVLRSSVDFSKTEPQYGDKGIPKFSLLTKGEVRNDALCYLTYTNEQTHKIIFANLDRAPIYNGGISGAGPRYCPSVEDKVVRFKDKERHQIFIEPEGADTEEMYVQGLSTSMPFDVQESMMKTIRGLENAQITRYGYAIEYDCIDPLTMLATLEIKGFKGLFAAGQINGSSGYEEAAGQGLIAGINAARFLEGKQGTILRRDEAYIGVLIDDLVTKGTNEPYRMMTSRAEHRLHLRQDNADIRLGDLGVKLGLAGEERQALYQARKAKIAKLNTLLDRAYSPERLSALCEKAGEPLPSSGIKARDFLKRPRITAELLSEFLEEFKDVPKEELKYLETEIKYEGYLAKQQRAIAEAVKMEEVPLSPDIDYLNIDGLRLEARQKFDKIKPLTLAQASRISGVSPADITVLMLHIRKSQSNKNKPL